MRKEECRVDNVRNVEKEPVAAVLIADRVCKRLLLLLVLRAVMLALVAKATAALCCLANARKAMATNS